MPELVRLTAQQVLDELRSADPEERARALASLWPQERAFLLTWSPSGTVTRAMNGPPSPDFFVLLLGLVTDLGQAFGLKLDWRRANSNAPDLVVANAMPPAPNRKAAP